jgi:hypothetical protein
VPLRRASGRKSGLALKSAGRRDRRFEERGRRTLVTGLAAGERLEGVRRVWAPESAGSMQGCDPIL